MTVGPCIISDLFYVDMGAILGKMRIDGIGMMLISGVQLQKMLPINGY